MGREIHITKITKKPVPEPAPANVNLHFQAS